MGTKYSPLETIGLASALLYLRFFFTVLKLKLRATMQPAKVTQLASWRVWIGNFMIPKRIYHNPMDLR